MCLLTSSLGLDDESCLIAEAVALFHDVGRFEQYRQYKTFKDSASVNHGGLGAQVLLRQGALVALPEFDREMITRAVALHNIFHLPLNLSAEALLYLKLIRDADKLDIWKVFIDYYEQEENERASAVGLGFPDIPAVSHEVLLALQKGEMVNLQHVTSLNDFKLLQLSWVFDLNFSQSFRLVMERRHLEKIAETLPPHPQVKETVDRVLESVASRLSP